MNLSKRNGILAIWHDMVAEHEPHINDWYNHEHHNERVQIDGIWTARRHVALKGAPTYFVFYETDDTSVLGSQAYLDCVNNPSPWTQRMMPHYRNTNRLVCHRVAFLGCGQGAYALTIRFNRPAGQSALSVDKVIERAQVAVKESGIASIQLWELDAERTHVDSKEKEIRGQPDGSADGIIVLSGISAEQVASCAERFFNNIDLETDGVLAGETDTGLYQLIFTMGG